MSDTKSDSAMPLREKWRALAGDSLPLELESVFRETDGFFVRRQNDQRARILGQLRPILLAALEPGERIRFAVRGQLYVAVEFFFTGHLAAHYTNQSALVVTDRRFILFQIDSKGRPKDLKNQIRLDRIRLTKSRWTGPWTIETVAGEKLTFTGLRKKDRRALSELIPGSPAAAATTDKSVEHLCPVCVRVVPGEVGTLDRCPNPDCRIPFRSPTKAAAYSALVPGVGDLYLRHFLFGSIEFAGSIFFLCLAIVVSIQAVVTRQTDAVILAAVYVGLFVILARVVDFLLTRHMARKGLVPLSTSPAPSGDFEGAPISPDARKSIPAFPVWCWVLFALGAVAVAASGWTGWIEAASSLRVAEACRLAEAGQTAEGEKIWDAQAARNPPGASDKARFALALWEGGNLDAGDRLIEGLGPIDKEVADKVNGFVDRLKTAVADHEAGRMDLLAGETEKAWPAIDRAVEFFSRLERANFPKSRHDVVVELAGDLLAPPPSDAEIEAARKLTALAGELPGGDARIEVARLRIESFGAPLSGAREPLEKRDLSGLDAGWRLLALETRASFAVDPAEIEAIVAEAEKISPEEIRNLRDALQQDARARRGALLAFGGRAEKIPEAALADAGSLAASQGWSAAAESIARRMPADTSAAVPVETIPAVGGH